MQTTSDWLTRLTPPTAPPFRVAST